MRARASLLEARRLRWIKHEASVPGSHSSISSSSRSIQCCSASAAGVYQSNYLIGRRSIDSPVWPWYHSLFPSLANELRWQRSQNKPAWSSDALHASRLSGSLFCLVNITVENTTDPSSHQLHYLCWLLWSIILLNRHLNEPKKKRFVFNLQNSFIFQNVSICMCWCGATDNQFSGSAFSINLVLVFVCKIMDR